MPTPLYVTIYNDIIVNTNRPHQRAETDKAIREATLELHSKDFFDLDIDTSLIQTTAAPLGFSQFILPDSVLVRKIKNISPVSSDGQVLSPLLDKKIGSRFNDLSALGYSGWFSNIGKQLTISTPIPYSTFQITYYGLPSVAAELYNSWIAKTYPYMVVDLATAKLFHSNGMEAEARIYYGRVGNRDAGDSHVHILIAEHSDRN